MTGVQCCQALVICSINIALSPGPSQILSHSRGEKSGEGLGAKLRHGPEMVDSVSINRVHHFQTWLVQTESGLY